eukprot:3583641-Rhodomonas_salina.2
MEHGRRGSGKGLRTERGGGGTDGQRQRQRQRQRERERESDRDRVQSAPQNALVLQSSNFESGRLSGRAVYESAYDDSRRGTLRSRRAAAFDRDFGPGVGLGQ